MRSIKRLVRKWREREPVKKVDGKEAKLIIENYEPRGLFYVKAESGYVGIDNSTGNAWTEEFRSLRRCKKWLRGKIELIE